MTRYVLDIPRWHPAPLNQLLGHWATANRRKKSDRLMVLAYARQAKFPQAERKRQVEMTITLKPKARACDPDAYYKSTLDALVHAGLLVNDSYLWVTLLPVAFRRGTTTDWGTRIVLTDTN